jgi:hypothetical protein
VLREILLVNVVSMAKKMTNPIGRLEGVLRGITCQTMRQLYDWCARQVMVKAYKAKIKAVKNLALKRVLGAFKSTTACIL